MKCWSFFIFTKKMDYFYLGRKFSSYDEVQAVLKQLKEDTKAEFCIRNCRTFNIKRSKRERYVNKALNYITVKLVCIRGGRPFCPRGRGLRRRVSYKVGCNAFILLSLSKCGQYLQVTKICLDHNHEIEPRPPSKMEKRTERRRQRLMERMKVSYEEAVILERMNVSAKEGLVGPLEEDSIFDEKSSESSDNFESETADHSSNSNLKQTDCIYKIEDDKQSSTEEQNCDEDTRLSMDLDYNSDDDSDQDNDITLQQMISSAKKREKTSQTNTLEKENEEHCVSDEEDYRRPLIIPGSQPKKVVDEEKDDNDVPILEQNLFTRKGDSGMASTFSGMLKYKDDAVFEALGSIEELSSFIGYAKEFVPPFCTDISSELVEVQCVLQDMVIHVGTPQRSCTEFERVNSQFPETHVKHLEDLITIHETRLPSANAIILPSGGQSSCTLHVARAICRRAERNVVCLVRAGDANRTVACYLNRLGDYLFVAARIASFISGKKECIYTRPSYNISPNTSFNTSTNQGYSVIYFTQPTK